LSIITVIRNIILAGPANNLYRSTNGEIDTWYIYNWSYKSAVAVHKHLSPVVDYSNPSVPDIAHLGKIRGVDNQYNRR
jgi:hypothetical protein